MGVRKTYEKTKNERDGGGKTKVETNMRALVRYERERERAPAFVPRRDKWCMIWR